MEGASNNRSKKQRSKKQNSKMKLSDQGLAIDQDPTDATSPKEGKTFKATQIIGITQAQPPTTGCDSNDEYVQLVVEGHSLITIKKQALRDASPYFRTLLNQELTHTAPPANVHVDSYVAVLHSVPAKVQFKVDESNMWEFFVLSRRFLLKQLEETCSQLIRKALPTLTMDELCRLWHNAHAKHCDDVKKWFLAGIVRSFDQASHSKAFMSLRFDELVAILSDDEFLPLREEDVYEAIIGWCEYDAPLRMTSKHLDILLAEIVWDRYDSGTIRKLAARKTPLLRCILENFATRTTERKRPKRAVERHLIFGHDAFKRGSDRTRELLHFDCLRGTLRVWNAPTARTLCTKETWRYSTHDLNAGHPTVIFVKKYDRGPPVDVSVIVVVNLVEGYARLIGNGLSRQCSMDMVMGGYDVLLQWCYRKSYGFLGCDFHSSERGTWERKPAPFRCADLAGVASCSLQLAGSERTFIVHLLSFFRRDEPHKLIPDSVIGFHDKHKDFFSAFELLPLLPAPRHGSAIVQCGTFLFVTGGADMTDDNVELAKRCYRLDLTLRDRWERIGDLSGPRVDHCMFVQCDRVFVYGGSTLDAKKKKVAVMSFETYDPYADVWTVFNIPVTRTDQEKVGNFGDTEQTTYCIDLGGSLDETTYRDMDDPSF